MVCTPATETHTWVMAKCCWAKFFAKFGLWSFSTMHFGPQVRGANLVAEKSVWHGEVDQLSPVRHR